MATRKAAEAGVSSRVRTAALEVLEAAYRKRVEQIAADLVRTLERGKLLGWLDDVGGPGPRRGRPPLWRLERECRRRLLHSKADAHLLLALSPSADRAEGKWTDVRYHAGAAAALDVIGVIRERGWDRRPPDGPA